MAHKDEPRPPTPWADALESPADRLADDPNACHSMQAAESLLAIEPPEFTAPMGLTLDMDRVKIVISKHLRNRMRLADRYNRLSLFDEKRQKALADKHDLTARARPTDPPAIQYILKLAAKLERCEQIQDDKLRENTEVQLYKQMGMIIAAFEGANAKIFTEMWELVEMHQRQTEHKDKISSKGLGEMTTAQLMELRDASIKG